MTNPPLASLATPRPPALGEVERLVEELEEAIRDEMESHHDPAPVRTALLAAFRRGGRGERAVAGQGRRVEPASELPLSHHH